MKDKYGYDIPLKTPHLIKQGSGLEMEIFQKHMKEITKIAINAYPDEKSVQNRFNLMMNCTSELLSELMVNEIEAHEKGEIPKYEKTLALIEIIIERLDMLLVTFKTQELVMAKYLSKCPDLLRDENRYIHEEMKKMGYSDLAEKLNDKFNNLFEKEFGPGSKYDARKDKQT